MSFATASAELSTAALADFGQSATLTLAGVAGTFAITGVYGTGYESASVHDLPVQRGNASLLVKTADLDTIGTQAGRAVRSGDSVTVAGLSFELVAMEPDDGGMTALILRMG